MNDNRIISRGREREKGDIQNRELLFLTITYLTRRYTLTLLEGKKKRKRYEEIRDDFDSNRNMGKIKTRETKGLIFFL